MKKNERRLTKVRQSKFFFKALENTIKISIPYKNTVYFRFTEKVHCFFGFAISRAYVGVPENACIFGVAIPFISV